MVKQKNKFKVYRRVCEGPALLQRNAELFIADSARTAARHRNRRNWHASHRITPTPQHLQPKRRLQLPPVLADLASQIRRQWRKNTLLGHIRAPWTQVLPNDAVGSKRMQVD
jgi:hypothetical protein